MPPVTSLSFHQDGTFLVSAAQNGSISLFNAVSGSLVKTVHVKKSGVGVVAFTHHPSAILASAAPSTVAPAPSGGFGAPASAASSAADDHMIRYLSLHDNRDLRYFRGHSDAVTALSMCPTDDTFLSSSLDATLRTWDLRADRCQGVIRAPAPSLAVVDPAGLVLAVATDNNCVKLFDRRQCEGGPFGSFFLPGAVITPQSLTFTPDGASLVIAGAHAPAAGLGFGSAAATAAPAAASAAAAGITDANGANPGATGRIVVLDSFDGRATCDISVLLAAAPRSAAQLEALGVSLPADAAETLAAAASAAASAAAANAAGAAGHGARARTGPALRASLAPGGRVVSAGLANGTVCSWDITTGKLIEGASLLHAKQTAAGAVAWNPRRAQLASADLDEVVLWAPQH